MGTKPKHIDTLDITHKAAHFDEPSAPSTTFYRHVRDGYPWLNSGVTLLRASHALVDRCKKDDLDQADGGRAWVPRSLHMVAVMNAALAVENALKGVILCTDGRVAPSKMSQKERDRIPKKAEGHNLSALARNAGFAPTLEHERNAIEYGHKYTTWLGRYPATFFASEWSGFSMTNTYPLVTAYTSIFFQLVEEVSRREYGCGRGGDRAGRTVDEYAAGEVARYRDLVAL